MGDGKGVILGTDLHDNLHVSIEIEILEGVDGGAELVVHALVGDLEGTDVLEALNSDFGTASRLFVEVNRLQDAGHDSVHQCDDDGRKDEPSQKLFEKSVHYF
jgi:hypothetical protein